MTGVQTCALPISQELREYANQYYSGLATNKDGDSVTALGKLNQVWDHNFKLLTTSGSVVKAKTATRDGADWYFYVDDEHIVLYSNTKTLTAESGKKKGDHDFDELNDKLNTWKKWSDADKKAGGSGRFNEISNPAIIESMGTLNYLKEETSEE